MLEEIENSSPEVTETPESGDASSGAQETAEQAPESFEAALAKANDDEQKLLELESVERFRYGGKEWTTKDLQSAILRQEDYTRKTQALAEERKYYDNLGADLDAVKRNPALAAQFKQIYPQKFHSYLGYVGNNQAQPSQQKVQDVKQAPQAVDQELLSRLNKLESHYQAQTQKAADAEVSANCEKFGQKYTSVKGPYETLALNVLSARLQTLKKQDPGAKLSEQDWDQAFKSVHEQNQKLADQLYAEKVKNQKQANARGRDVAPGGGIPGQAPKQARTLREGTEAMLAHFANETN